MADLKSLYESSNSDGIKEARALGTADGRQGTNFFDGTGRGPWSPTFQGTADVWQSEFREYKEGKNVNPAGTNNASYPLSRWKPDSLKLAFEGVGPAQRPDGYWRDTRFTEFKDSAGRWTQSGYKLHKYAPIKDKNFKDLNTSADTRIRAGATSTGVGGING